MHNICRVHIKDSPDQLVNEILNMLIRKILGNVGYSQPMGAFYLSRVDDSVEISFHEISHNVNIIISSLCFGLDDVDNTDDVFVLKESFTQLKKGGN